ncbi:MAG: LysR substrate-binding domain-containing protein, partial [Casimicrobium sp.]
DLHHHKIIVLQFGTGQTVPWEFKNRAGKATTFETQSPALIVSDTETVGDAAVLGLGISRVSLHFAWPHLVAKRLKVVLNEFNVPGKREMVIQYPHRENVAPRVKAFVTFAIEALAKEPSFSATLNDAARFSA